MESQHIKSQIAQLRSEIRALKDSLPEDKITIAVFNGELDKVLTAFVVATGAAAMGMEVVMYFTLWAIPVLLDKNKVAHDKEATQGRLGANLPKGAGAVELSKMNPGGINTSELKSLMKRKKIPSLEEMISVAEELGIRIYIAAKSMEMLGFERHEFIDYKGLEFAGVATFVQEAQKSKVQLFI